MARVADMVRAAQAAALAQQYQQRNAPGVSAPGYLSGDQAVVTSLSSNGFVSELEKHITDFRRGRAELSEKTAGKVQRFDEANNTLLQQQSPKASKNYGLYGTFMSYETRARYVSNIYSATREMAAITRTLKSA